MMKNKPMKPESPRSDLAIYLQCSKCGLAYSISIVGQNGKLLIGKLPCTTTGCKGRLRRSTIIHGARFISAEDLYLAAGGGGLPEERRLASPKLLKRDFEGAKIKKLDVEQGPGTRSFIRSITLENGHVMHLAASTKGATVFKVTEAKNGSR